MALTLHHLEAGLMLPPGVRLANDARRIVNHVVAIETPAGDLALIDTGIGSQARRDPIGRLGRFAGQLLRPDRDPSGSVAAQLEELGRSPAEVRDVLITHLDGDHASGLSDFPAATVHVHPAELAGARDPLLTERPRYTAANWAHGPRWSELGTAGGERFEGIAARPVEGLGFDALALELPGHTRGHTGYAIGLGEGRWLVHAGDAFYHAGLLEPGGRQSRYLQAFELVIASRPRLVAGNHALLCAAASSAGVEVVCTHSPELLERARRRAGAGSGAVAAR